MQIENNSVVSFHYVLREQGGENIESNQDSVPMAYLHGHGNILAGLEDAMVGLTVGDSKSVVLSPEQAYGPRREGAVQKVPVKHLAGKYKRLLPGMVVKVNTEKGAINARIIKPGKFMVELDMNHPFAGKTLEFDIEIKAIRAASEEEIAHGHAHGDGGHHH
ncbi:FKBP-type peptidyl-prolyl cis-trans isomerase [Teredinibacter waterburyi]|jgi:FKBP-type peptidyl-prolyl cis-trans isomerases 2|uniref:FKBP-type peptidyl-prolyl cis-trans isomerase n=1 Tax=Teredinibacter waterburyi TaxID=1500538 RepID=UPI00165FE43B|nr:peptidylprolyl isomerase [Teredinibacter waterburyi]